MTNRFEDLFEWREDECGGSIVPKGAPDDYKDDRCYHGGGYTQFVLTFGDIAARVDGDDYQGDTFLLLKRDGRWGFLVFGWGSCDGCDAYQACETLEDIKALWTKLRDSVRWGTAEEIARIIETRDGEWFFREEDFVRFVPLASQALGIPIQYAPREED